MYIAIFNWRDIRNPKHGGAEIVTHEYAKGWVKAGHKVTVICPAFPNSPKKEMIDGVEYIRLGVRTSWNYLLIHILAFFYYQRFLKGEIDLVIDQIHWVPFFTPLYVNEKKLAFIHEVAQGIWAKQFGLLIGGIGRRIEPLFFQSYNNIPFLTVSDSTRKDLAAFGIQEEDITVIRNGISIKPLTKLPIKEKDPTCIFIGRITPVKNIEEIIKAFSFIKMELATAKLWIVGGDDNKHYSNMIKKLIHEEGVDGAVKFFGYVSEKRKLELLRISHLLLHTSVAEGWGLNIIEANAMGTPAVVYNVSGLRESVVDGMTGVVCPVKNPKEMAKQILELFRNYNKYRHMQNECLKRTRQFPWKKSINESLKLIRLID